MTDLEGAEHEHGLVRIGLVAFVETGGGNDGVDRSHAEVVVVLRRQLLARQLEAVDLRVCACVRVCVCARTRVSVLRERGGGVSTCMCKCVYMKNKHLTTFPARFRVEGWG